jgi:putative ABC transport system substrate-binding protein
MGRRDMMAGAAATAGAGLSARLSAAQDRPRMLRVGFVSIANPRTGMPWSALEGRLRELGYVEGQNLATDYINLDGRAEGVSEAIRAQIARKADVLVALTEALLREAIAATSTIPIVMAAIDFDPLKQRYVKSLARPGGNVTGVVLQQIELAEKRLQVMKEADPDVATATVFWDGPSAQQWEASRTVARSLCFDLAGAQFTAPPMTTMPVSSAHPRTTGVC